MGRCAALLYFCVGATSALAQQAPQVVTATDINAAVSLRVDVTRDGTLVGAMKNNTDRRIGNVEILVNFAWIWSRAMANAPGGLGWSTTYTLPVEMYPGATIPVKIAPLKTFATRADGHYLISAKIVGYTRYRWVTSAEQDSRDDFVR